jgi:6-pyruvoyltetrahydropterin/6-carboxytetrahydropterin synthase
MYQSSKSYGHEIGFSCAFRQPNASSHCRFLHGYSLAFKLIFESDTLDNNGWVVDFGSLKLFKQWLESKFDHTTIIAENDPNLSYFQQGHNLGVLDLVVLSGVGCENFARYVYNQAASWVLMHTREGIRVVSVTVAEHGANSATYINPTLDITQRAMKQIGVLDG